MTARKSPPPPGAGQVILHNRLPPRHPQRLELENAIQSALAGLTGSWDVVLEVPGGPSLVVAVVTPDGSAWTMSCCNPRDRDPASIAETVKAACSRRRWLEPAGTAGGNVKAGAEAAGTLPSARERS